MSFKKCTDCGHVWPGRKDFLSDPDVDMLGYQVNYGDLDAGLFLFQHNAPECRTSLAIEAAEFTDMHEGPIFEDRLEHTEKCPDYCQHTSSLDPCSRKCECAYVRDVLHTVKNWPKADQAAVVSKVV